MAQLTLYKTVNNDGEYSCGDIGITTDEWFDLLSDNGANQYINTLLLFLREPNHTGSCNVLALKYGKPAQHFSAKITAFSKWVEKKLNRFHVVGTDGSDTYWCIVMQKGWYTPDGFQWQLRDELVNALHRLHNMSSLDSFVRNYWLVGYSFGSNNSQFDRFIKEAVWECWFSDDSTVGLSQLSLVKTIQKGDVIILKSSSVKGTNHSIPFLRVKAVGIVETDIEINKNNGKSFCSCKVSYFGIQDHDFDDATLSSFRKTIHYCNTDAKTQPVIDYANSILNFNNAVNMECQKYITLLEKTHNLILTGAPGTGKTYLANEIAKAMKAEVEFVQFHPSYDYTDFVEGLRPIQEGNGKVGFERKDGVFKVFCAKALENLLDSQKSLQTLQQEISVRDKIYEFVQKSIDENTEFETQGTKNKFHIIDSKPKSIVVEIPNNEKTKVISLQKSDLVTLLENKVQISSGGDIQVYFQRKYRTQQDSYTFALYNILKDTKNEVKQVSLVERKNFVFIIDEINRGEISKIFGELFFSIDPGYRGVKGKVQTQYANMETEPNDFDEALGEKEIFGHFFVPENVYIIGTMNDIDRSVESMDFAMRRRFAWKEVTAEDSMQMLDGMDNSDEIKARMLKINNEILHTPGLGKAYQIGAAYFKKYDLYNDFDLLWEYHLEGLLFEYLRGTTDIDKTMKKLADAYGYTKSNKYEPTSNN